MSDKNIEKKQQAQLLYITQGKTHAEIAAEVGVSERTVFTWVHQYAWDKLRLAAYQAPVSIANSLCEEIVELQQTIALRDAGQRFPTPQEAMTMQRMVSCLEKMKKYPSLSQNMQVLESFKNYMKPLDQDFSKTLGRYTNRYLSSAAQNGFVPYQLEYGIDAAPPLAPYYEEEDEVENNEPSASTWHPDDPVNYTVPGIHHARPYLVPLMHICHDQMIAEHQRTVQETKVVDDYLEQYYGTTPTATEVSGSKTEASSTENHSINTFGQTNHPEISGSAAEAPAKEGRKTEISARQNIFISPRLEDILTATYESETETTELVVTSALVYESGKHPSSETPQLMDLPETSGSAAEAPAKEGSKTEVSTMENDTEKHAPVLEISGSAAEAPAKEGSKTEIGTIENDTEKHASVPETSGSAAQAPAKEGSKTEIGTIENDTEKHAPLPEISRSLSASSLPVNPATATDQKTPNKEEPENNPEYIALKQWQSFVQMFKTGDFDQDQLNKAS